MEVITICLVENKNLTVNILLIKFFGVLENFCIGEP